MSFEELELEKPIGDFILVNADGENIIQSNNGAYFHYAEVCKLLRMYGKSEYNKALEDAASKQTRLVAAEILKLKK